MKIVIAPDSFKESLDAPSVARAIAEGLGRVLPEASFDLVPVADGGEGTVDALVAATGGRTLVTEVCDPLGRPVSARYGVLGGTATAVIEMAQASGLGLLANDERDPAVTTSFGTGQLILAALAQRPDRIILGLGGSATNDGGAGMLQALGVRFYDHRGREIAQPMSGSLLARVAALDAGDLDQRLRRVHFETACDVDNPLIGPSGASATFGPQKGATALQVTSLDRALDQFYQLIESSMQCSVRDRAGAGAAGGLGAAMLAFLATSLRPGVDIVMDAVRLAEHLEDAALVITGEGRVDAQTLRGKAPAGVARLAARHGVPVIIIGGSLALAPDLLESGVFDAFEAAVTRPMPVTDALMHAYPNLVEAGTRVGLWLRLCGKLGSLPGTAMK